LSLDREKEVKGSPLHGEPLVFILRNRSLGGLMVLVSGPLSTSNSPLTADLVFLIPLALIPANTEVNWGIWPDDYLGGKGKWTVPGNSST